MLNAKMTFSYSILEEDKHFLIVIEIFFIQAMQFDCHEISQNYENIRRSYNF